MIIEKIIEHNDSQIYAVLNTKLNRYGKLK